MPSVWTFLGSLRPFETCTDTRLPFPQFLGTNDRAKGTPTRLHAHMHVWQQRWDVPREMLFSSYFQNDTIFFTLSAFGFHTFFLITKWCCLWWLLNKERAVFSCNLSAPESGTWHMSGYDKWCSVPVISPGMPLRCPRPWSQMLLLN